MGAIIFNGADGKENRGRVTVLEAEGAAGGSILDVENWEGFNAFKAIFTKVSIAEQTNHQFLHTIGDRIYLYVFGDRIGSLGLTGVAFYDNCNVGGGDKIGVAHVVDYWRKQRLRVQPEPMRITIDPETVFECYLHSVQAQTFNTAQRLYQFHLSFALLPEQVD